jgi:hypothetical protein
MICSSLNLLVLMSIILQVDGLLGKMAGPVYGGQLKMPIRRGPLELGCRASQACMMLTLTNSSLYFAHGGKPLFTVFCGFDQNHETYGDLLGGEQVEELSRSTDTKFVMCSKVCRHDIPPTQAPTWLTNKNPAIF